MIRKKFMGRLCIQLLYLYLCILYITYIVKLYNSSLRAVLSNSVLFFIVTLRLSDVDLAFFFTPWIWPVWSLSLNLYFTKLKDRLNSCVWCVSSYLLLFHTFNPSASLPSFSTTLFSSLFPWLHLHVLYISKSIGSLSLPLTLSLSFSLSPSCILH